MTVLKDYQIQLGSTGVVMGGVGSAYKVEAFEGIGRMTASRGSERGFGDGGVAAPHWAPPRSVSITLNIVGSSAANAVAKYDALAADWATGRGTEDAQLLTPLRFKLPGRVAQQLTVGRPERIEPDLASVVHGLVRAVATYWAFDPKIYSDAEHLIDIPYGTTQTLTNIGNHPAPVWWDVNGSATNPGLIRDESARFDITDAISAGVFYRVRTAEKTVTRSSDGIPNGQFSKFSGTWLEIPTGGAVFRAVRDSGAAGSHITGTYRDTWL